MLAALVRLGPRIALLTPVAFLGSIIADAAPNGTDSAIDALFKGGPFAFVLGLILLDKLITPGERNLLRVQLKESQDRERVLYEKVNSEIVPAIVDNSRINKETIRPLLERLIHKLDSE